MLIRQLPERQRLVAGRTRPDNRLSPLARLGTGRETGEATTPSLGVITRDGLLSTAVLASAVLLLRGKDTAAPPSRSSPRVLPSALWQVGTPDVLQRAAAP